MPSGRRETMPVVSLLPASAAQRRMAAIVVGVTVAVCLAAAPFARTPQMRIDAFIPAYQAAYAISETITAALLFGQFAIIRSRGLLALASSYLFGACMAVAHALTFPGLFAPGGLFGAGPQSTAWLYMAWHGGVATLVVAYAAVRRPRILRRGLRTGSAIAGCVLGVLAVVCGLTTLATAGHGLLPEIMQANHYRPIMRFAVSAVWLANALALLLLLRRRPYSVLDVWLIAAACAWLCDIALSAVLNGGRFDLGFYAGRLYGLLAASFVLLALLQETIALYVRLAHMLDAERLERDRQLHELNAELVHVSRLSELGQMVSALAHEVAQPLAAIGNYLNACRRLLDVGDQVKLRTALDQAAGQANRASQVVGRLRDFIRKTESRRRVEDLRTALEESIALGVLGADRQAVTVELALHQDASAALIDKIQVQQVLLNLIRNGIEAMRGLPNPTLRLAAVPSQDDMIEISVADSGPGLPVPVRERLFQPFNTTKSDGMGVGLSICRTIVEAHGGRIWAADDAGGGTVFRFTIPKGQAAAVAGSAASMA